MIAPRVAEAAVRRARQRDAGRFERRANGCLVVDDEPEVPLRVRRLRAPACERDELVAHVDERHRAPDPAAQLELEEPAVPRECLVEVAHFERNVVDADEPGHA